MRIKHIRVGRELKEAKVLEFLTFKQDFLSVHEYGLKFTQLSRYVHEIVKDMRSRMSLFVAGLGSFQAKRVGLKCLLKT